MRTAYLFVLGLSAVIHRTRNIFDSVKIKTNTSGDLFSFSVVLSEWEPLFCMRSENYSIHPTRSISFAREQNVKLTSFNSISSAHPSSYVWKRNDDVSNAHQLVRVVKFESLVSAVLLGRKAKTKLINH